MQLNIFQRLFARGAHRGVNTSANPLHERSAHYDGGYSNTIYVQSYTGEKNQGELGPAMKYYLDYDYLRAKSWQLYLDSELCQLLFRRMNTWVVGNGLKLRAEPSVDILAGEGAGDLNRQKFKDVVESRFDIYGKDAIADYSDMVSLHELAEQAEINAMVGGDVLVVIRLVDGVPKVQLIDGANVCTPLSFSFNQSGWATAENGNRVRHGVELDATGKHLAFYVKTTLLTWERIPARGEKSGKLMAWLYYGLKYRLDNVRGLPLIAAVMETSSKLERYKEAAVGSAEERAKVSLVIEHSPASDGSNPFGDKAAKLAKSMGQTLTPTTIDGKQLAEYVAATTNKQAVNLPIGAKMNTVDSKNELYFADFYGVNLMLICATVGIPKDVAMMLYGESYSASRAAIKDWEHSINVRRQKTSDHYYKPIYNIWLDIQVLSKKVAAPNYLSILGKRDPIAIGAYKNCRFVGASVPHIDPVKEVEAVRLKLGSSADHIPLMTLEDAAEALDTGNEWDILERFGNEMEEAAKHGIMPPEKLQVKNNVSS